MPCCLPAKAMSAQAFFQRPLVAAQASGPPQPSCSHSGSGSFHLVLRDLVKTETSLVPPGTPPERCLPLY